MSGCPKCGHDPDAAVAARWEFAIGLEVESLNAHRVNAGARWQQAVYRRKRDAWHWAFKVARINHGITHARPGSKRRVHFVRVMGPKQRAFDDDNLRGGCKMVLDAMVLEGLVHDDRPEFVEVSYDQQRGARPGLIVTIEELA